MADNRFDAFPPPVLQLRSLRTLVLDGNQLDALPAGVAQLSALESLSLVSNRLSSLPPELGLLPRLRALLVSRNALTTLPDSLGDLASLEELVAAHNDLAALPPSLGRLTRLRLLNLDANPRLGGVPEDVLRGCVALATLSLHGCGCTAAALHAAPGWAEMEARIEARHRASVAGGVMPGARGLDDGLDRG